MSLMLLLLAVLCAGTMGYAIQRGATCMVAAVDEVVNHRRATRLLSLIEAAAVVSGGLLLWRFLGHLPMQPSQFAVGVATILGGMLLGLGAFTARSCVFGAIARLGSGEWAYFLVPVGYFLGCVVFTSLVSQPQMAAAGMSPLFDIATILTLPIAGWAAFRLVVLTRHARTGKLAEHVWSPHIATAIIGLTFVIMLIAVGPWSYTEYLAEAARGMPRDAFSRSILLLSLLGGAILGGWTAGRIRTVPITAGSVVRCLLGGALMGLGSLMIPGGNDGLILVGIPLLHPYAWVALATMFATIAVSMITAKQLSYLAASKEKA